MRQDTLIVLRVDTIVPEARIDTVTKLNTDTIEVVKDQLSIRYVRMPGDSIWITGKCDTIKINVIKEVSVEVIRSTPSDPHVPWWLWIIVGFLVLVVLGLLFK